MLKNRNYDNDNDKLQCFTKTFNSQKYKKCSPGKHAMLLYVAVSIHWISIRLDACCVLMFIRQLKIIKVETKSRPPIPQFPGSHFLAE